MPRLVLRLRHDDGIRVNGPAVIKVQPLDSRSARLVIEADISTRIERFEYSPAPAPKDRTHEPTR